MTWCNKSDEEEEEALRMTTIADQEHSVTDPQSLEIRTITCPSCGHSIQLQDQTGIHDLLGLPSGVKFDPTDNEILEHLEAKVMSDSRKLHPLIDEGIHDLPGLPSGVKFDPTDNEILEHLEAKVMSDSRKLHPLIDEYIPTLEGENGICYTHPEKLPGVGKDGQIRHFFHRPSKAYTTGTRKRRKVHTDTDGSETRWHKTGKTRKVVIGGGVTGFKKILVLYTNYGRQRKPEKTNWVMHQYHLGNNEEEKDGELVVSKVFYQTQPRQGGSSSTKGNSLEGNFIDRSGHNSNIIHVPKSSSTLIDYYNSPFISYDLHGSHYRESSPQLIPNLVGQGGASSFIRLAADTSNNKA